MKKFSNASTFFRLLAFILKNNKFRLLFVLLFIGITSLTTLTSTLFMRTLIDNYIVPLTQMDNPEFGSLAQTLFKLAFILITGVVCAYLQSRLMISVTQGLLLRMRKDVFDKMQTLPVSYFDTRKHGDIMSVYTNDIDNLRQMVSSSLTQAFSSLVTVVVTFVSMIVLSVQLTVVSIVMVTIMVFVTKRLSQLSRHFFKKRQKGLADMNGFIEEMVSGQKVVKVFCYEDRAIEDFLKVNENLRDAECSANKIANIVMPVNGNLNNLTYVLLAVVGSLLALNGQTALSIGTLVSFLSLNKSFAQPISHLSQQINSILQALVGAERVYALLDEKPEEDNGTVTLVNIEDSAECRECEKKTGKWAWKDRNGNLTTINGGIRFENVDFSYMPERQILYDIDIEAMPDMKIAFVGGTGAGKTTIINLINRFYEIQDGAIYYDGINVKNIRKDDLRRSLGMVLQDVNLFSGTVIDNIRYGRLEATDQECIEAAKLVGADDFIRRLSNGYHTRLSDNGSDLSQGERQLLSIARAAVANPPVLILDEATSSIDTRTEMLVQRGMDSLMKGRTTFVIAHRLSTVRNADCIVVLEKGHIIEKGTHDELLRQHGKYYSLYEGGMM